MIMVLRYRMMTVSLFGFFFLNPDFFPPLKILNKQNLRKKIVAVRDTLNISDLLHLDKITFNDRS